jgi:hypothetical protein
VTRRTQGKRSTAEEEPVSLEEVMMRVAFGEEAFALEGAAVARAPEGVAVVELEGIPPVVAGLAARADDGRPLVADVRAAARGAVTQRLHLLPSERTPAPERTG